MNSRKIKRTINRFLYALGAIVLLYLLLYSIDRIYGRYYSRTNSAGTITVERGDIIYKVTSFMLAGSNYPYYGSFPGHLGIFLSDTTIAVKNSDFKKMLVAESSLFNIKEKKMMPVLRINPAENNYGYAGGRLLLVKTHLNDSQKEKLQRYVELNSGKPYQLFAKKNDSISFNCATFVWNAFNSAVNIDVDANGGKTVLPADILSYFMKKEDAEIIRF
ncbi:hypothetical protein KCV26_16090 [Petrimonas sulfuriphila]|uniref:hypothetical protein n=1 Tax=Petrimonas sulfuriphila TaxID=285070 RepID=UPI00324F567F